MAGNDMTRDHPPRDAWRRAEPVHIREALAEVRAALETWRQKARRGPLGAAPMTMRVAPPTEGG